MKRERQWDMFDVATGACGLDDYLFQRYSENDLMSKFWVEKTDHVDELRKPPEGSESKEQVIVPIQGPRAGTPVAPAEPVNTQPLPSRPSWETGGAPEALPSRPPWEAPAAAAAASPPAPQAPAQPAYTPPSAPPVRPPQPAALVEAPAAAAPPWSPPASTPAAPAPAAPPPEPPKPPSMEELLARFHQATAAYEERAKDELPADETPREDP